MEAPSTTAMDRPSLMPERQRLDPAARRALIEELTAAGGGSADAAPGAARSQDFLYGEDGLRG